MELNSLKYFYAVAKEGSFTRASQVLRIQQPAISKMVRQLEDRLGLVLLERHKRGVRLTQAGAEIFRSCEGIFHHIEEIKTFSDREQTECRGPLSIGVTDSVSSYIIPKVLSALLKHHPDVRPSIFAGSSNLVCREIQEGRIELGIFFTVPDKEDFSVTELRDMPFQVVTSAQRDTRPDAKNAFIISREVDYPKARPFPVLEMLRQNKIKMDVLISSNNLDSQKHMVLEGLGVALLPAFMVQPEIERGLLRVVYPKKEFSYSLKLVTRKRKVLSKNAATFLEEFRAVI